MANMVPYHHYGTTEVVVVYGKSGSFEISYFFPLSRVKRRVGEERNWRIEREAFTPLLL